MLQGWAGCELQQTNDIIAVGVETITFCHLHQVPHLLDVSPCMPVTCACKQYQGQQHTHTTGSQHTLRTGMQHPMIVCSKCHASSSLVPVSSRDPRGGLATSRQRPPCSTLVQGTASCMPLQGRTNHVEHQRMQHVGMHAAYTPHSPPHHTCTGAPATNMLTGLLVVMQQIFRGQAC